MDEPGQARAMNTRREPEVVDTKGASSIVGLKVPTLVTLRCRGGGPPFLRIGRAVRYPVDLLRQWRDARLVTSNADTSEVEAAENVTELARVRAERAHRQEKRETEG